eukprot:3487191-Pyramimonas_sp.AAC.1
MMSKPTTGAHPGSVIKCKAAESGVLFEFALDLLRRYVARVDLGVALLKAGEAMADWLHVTRTADIRLTRR